MKVISFYILALTIITQGCSAQKLTTIDYPELTYVENKENYFGTIINDTLVTLENMDNPEVLKWFKKQDSLCSNWFDNSEFLLKKYASYKDFSKLRSVFIWDVKTSDSGNLAYLKRKADEKSGNLYFRRNESENETLLFKPSEYKDGDFNLIYFEPSYSGNFIALAMNDGASTSEIVVFDVRNKLLLDNEPILYTRPDFAGGVDWLPDESGFTYLKFPNATEKSKVLKENSESMIYDIVSGKSKPIFGKSSGIKLNEKHYPVISISSGQDEYVYGRVGHAGRYWTTYVTRFDSITKGKFGWEMILEEGDKVLEDYARIVGDRLIYVSEKDESTRILSSQLIDSKLKETLWAAKKEEIIKDLQFTEEKIIFTTIIGTELKLFLLSYKGDLTEVKLPYPAIDIELLSQYRDSGKQKIVMSGATKANLIYNIVGDTLSKSPFLISDEFPQFDDIITETMQAEAHDGEMIPVTVIRSKTNKEPSKLMLEAYGAYGDVLRPYFDFVKLKWISEGGKIAIAHVRGGGAKGLSWHQAGMKQNKSNSWKDVNSCAEFLLENGVAESGKLFLFSNSSGGITLGMALNERPDLFSAMALMSPRLNPVKLESSNKGSTSFEEYGSMDNVNGAKALIKMDPYLNIKNDVNYPQVYIIAGFKDDRVPLSDPGKYIAKLQSLNPQNTYLLDIYYNRGHRVYSWGAMAKVMNFFDFSTLQPKKTN